MKTALPPLPPIRLRMNRMRKRKMTNSEKKFEKKNKRFLLSTLHDVKSKAPELRNPNWLIIV